MPRQTGARIRSVGVAGCPRRNLYSNPFLNCARRGGARPRRARRAWDFVSPIRHRFTQQRGQGLLSRGIRTFTIYQDFCVVTVGTHQHGLIVNLLLSQARFAIDYFQKLHQGSVPAIFDSIGSMLLSLLDTQCLLSHP